jgi:hypothetical protein
MVVFKKNKIFKEFMDWHVTGLVKQSGRSRAIHVLAIKYFIFRLLSIDLLLINKERSNQICVNCFLSTRDDLREGGPLYQLPSFPLQHTTIKLKELLYKAQFSSNQTNAHRFP